MERKTFTPMKWSSPQVVSAMMMLVSGIFLAVLSYLRSDNNDIPDGVLWYVSQVLIYSGSIFGIKVYIDHSIKKLGNK